MNALIGLADDHVLLRNGLATLLQDLGHTVVLEADNGVDFIAKLKTAQQKPQLVLLDINMPQMNGYETALWLKTYRPGIKVIALSMYDDEAAIIRMLNNGARGYLLKDCEPAELDAAIQAVLEKGVHYSNTVTGRVLQAVHAADDEPPLTPNDLHDKELQFIKWACTELTYKEIAEQMGYSPRTIDGFRDGLFQKLRLKSRVGLVLFAIRHGLIAV